MGDLLIRVPLLHVVLFQQLVKLIGFSQSCLAQLELCKMLAALEKHDRLFQYQLNTDGKRQLDQVEGDRRSAESEFLVFLLRE